MTPDEALATSRIEHLLRTEAPQVLAALVRRFGRFDIAEDAVQEALFAAIRQWPADRVPDTPRSWLIRVAYRRMVDMLRAEQARHRREQEVGSAELAFHEPSLQPHDGDEGDDSLILLLMCCHPALDATSQLALTLRAMGGLTTAEIAHAFGTTEPTMAARISRAKQKLAQAGAKFTLPARPDLPARVTNVMRVLYLIFNEGYTASAGGRLARKELSNEAIRLARMLRISLPGHPEVTGLLALMLLTDARHSARLGDDHSLIPLDQQDRSRWDQDLIREGIALIDNVWDPDTAGQYQVQAAIAAVHAVPASDQTDWPQIAMLYSRLEQITPTPPVRLSRVVAVAKAHGPDQGLALLNELIERHRLDEEPLTRHRERAVRAHLLELTGDTACAASLFRQAAALTDNQVERRYLLGKASALTDGT